VNRRAFMASIAAAFAAGHVELLKKPPPLILRTDCLYVGPGQEFVTIRWALKHAAPGAVVWLMPGHRETLS
jgi:hypothetical protein